MMSTTGQQRSTALHDGSSLQALRERVAKAAGPDREIDARICQALLPYLSGANYGRPGLVVDMAAPSVLGGGQIAEAPPLTASIDAAIRLVERVLPGWRWDVGSSTVDYSSMLWDPAPAGASTAEIFARTAPLAILLALLDALIAQGTQPDEYRDEAVAEIKRLMDAPDEPFEVVPKGEQE